MNKSVLRTMLVVIISMLAFEYILKFFVPEEFVLVVSNPNLIKFGTFLDTHKIFYYMFYCCTSFITNFLFTCACSRRKKLNWKYYLSFVVLYAISQILTEHAYQLLTPFLVLSMVTFAYISNSNMKDFTICFGVHTIAQNLSLEIRGITRYIMSNNSIVFTLLTSECYLWLLLMYILNCYNIKEREVN